MPNEITSESNPGHIPPSHAHSITASRKIEAAMASKTGQLNATTAPIKTGAATAAKKATDREGCFFITRGIRAAEIPLTRSSCVSSTLFIPNNRLRVKMIYFRRRNSYRAGSRPASEKLVDNSRLVKAKIAY